MVASLCLVAKASSWHQSHYFLFNPQSGFGKPALWLSLPCWNPQPREPVDFPSQACWMKEKPSPREFCLIHCRGAGGWGLLSTLKNIEPCEIEFHCWQHVSEGRRQKAQEPGNRKDECINTKSWCRPYNKNIQEAGRVQIICFQIHCHTLSCPSVLPSIQPRQWELRLPPVPSEVTLWYQISHLLV